MKAARGLLSAIVKSVDEVSAFHSHTEQRRVTWLIVGNPETDRLPVAGSISEWPVIRSEGQIRATF